MRCVDNPSLLLQQGTGHLSTGANLEIFETAAYPLFLAVRFRKRLEHPLQLPWSESVSIYSACAPSLHADHVLSATTRFSADGSSKRPADSDQRFCVTNWRYALFDEVHSRSSKAVSLKHPPFSRFRRKFAETTPTTLSVCVESGLPGTSGASGVRNVTAGRSVVVFSPYWLVNRTGDTVVYRLGNTGARESRAVAAHVHCRHASQV